MTVGNETWSVRTDEKSSDQITDNRRQADTMRRESKDEGGYQSTRQGEDQVEGVHGCGGVFAAGGWLLAVRNSTREFQCSSVVARASRVPSR